MRLRTRLVWKLGATVVVIVTVVILLNGLFGILLSRQYALNASRKAMRFDSASIVKGIEILMMRDHDTGVLEFIEKNTREGATYLGISLISHPSGKICMSGGDDVGSFLGMGDQTCKRCHAISDSPSRNFAAYDELTTGRDGSRVLRVSTPIINKPGCRAADCHIHTDDKNVLGVLEADYSLASFDSLIMGLNTALAACALAAIGLVIVALVMTFRWFLAKPLRRLLKGLRTLGSGDLSFRFSARRNDEIGLVANSFDQMATRIETQQNELLKTLDSLQGIVENTADIVITVGKQDLIQTFNRGAEQVLGYGRSEVLGRPVQMLMADPQERDIAVARLSGRDNVMNWESRFKTKNGKIKNVLLTLSRLRDRDGNLLGTLAIGKDISIEKELQRKLIRSEQEAAIGRAVTAIQHAIKNMLNTLKGGVYIVRLGSKKHQSERIAEGCDMIEEGLTQISDLAHHMLRYAREWTIEPEPVDLADMIRRVAVAVSQTGTERNAAVRTEVDRSLSRVLCDPRLIHMGLMDIASNALDACLMKDYPGNESPEIVIRTRRDEGKGLAVVEIQDNGIGMTPEVQASIFVPFFSTKKKGGTGLGMALTARIIDLHDGKIEVESEPGIGSRFCITLPLEGPAKRQGEG